MPHANRLLAELPRDMATWLVPHASAETIEALARDVAVTVGRRLRFGDPPGEGGWNHALFDILRRDPSPAVRHLAGELGCADRTWTAKAVTRQVVAYFELFGGWKHVYARLRDRNGHNSLATDAAA